jgi:dual specificity phosphatase 12
MTKYLIFFPSSEFTIIVSIVRGEMTDSSPSSSRGPSKVLSFLYLGDMTNAKSLSTLLSHDIKYIVNCTPPKSIAKAVGVPNFYEKDRRFTYLRVPVYDDGGENLLPHLPEVARFINEGKHFGSVLVHCRQGVSRSAAFVAGYLMQANEFTVDEAIDYLRGVRPAVRPNESFVAQLREFGRRLEAGLQHGRLGGGGGDSATGGASCSAGPSLAPAAGTLSGPKPASPAPCVVPAVDIGPASRAATLDADAGAADAEPSAKKRRVEE